MSEKHLFTHKNLNPMKCILLNLNKHTRVKLQAKWQALFLSKANQIIHKHKRFSQTYKKKSKTLHGVYLSRSQLD